MPKQPGPVNWDFIVAQDTVFALRRVAQRIRESLEQRRLYGAQAIADWRGPHRDSFDDYFGAITAEALQIAEQYEEAAQRISLATEWAKEENVRRRKGRR